MKTQSHSKAPRLSGVLTAALLATFAMHSTPAGAASTTGSLALSSLYFAQEDLRWDGYTFLARDAVESLNSGSARAVDALDDALNLSEATPIWRTFFLLTAGQAQMRFTWANSVMAHEYAHFQHAHGFGMTEHYFVDDETGDEISSGAAWWRVFLKGEVGGPAVSADGAEGRDHEYDAEEGIRRALSGLNWQMSYSENRWRSWMAGEQRSVFDASDFVLNRIYTFSYTLGTALDVHGKGPGFGDPGKFATHIEDLSGTDNVLEKAAAVALISDLMSPAVISMASSFGPYISVGEKSVQVPGIKLANGSHVTWDVPHYLNVGNMSVAPTSYWLATEEQAARYGADALVLGLGVETSVIGESSSELRATLDGRWGATELSAGLSLAVSGRYVDASFAYDLGSGLAIAGGGAARAGDTMRADRELPDADKIAWIGLQYRF